MDVVEMPGDAALGSDAEPDDTEFEAVHTEPGEAPMPAGFR